MTFDPAATTEFLSRARRGLEIDVSVKNGADCMLLLPMSLSKLLPLNEPSLKGTRVRALVEYTFCKLHSTLVRARRKRKVLSPCEGGEVLKSLRTTRKAPRNEHKGWHGSGTGHGKLVARKHLIHAHHGSLSHNLNLLHLN